MKRSLVWTLGLCVALAGCGGVEGDESFEDFGEVESEATTTLPSSEVAWAVPAAKAAKATKRTFKTAASFRSFFGVDAAQAGLDFSREWAVFYAAGPQRSGGFRASIASLSLSSTGKTLTVRTQLESPGRGCMVTLALTSPSVLVKFPKPRVAPTSVRYAHAKKVRDCEAADPCAAVRCPGGTRCDASSGSAECVQLPTCAAMLCAPGTFCDESTGEARCVEVRSCETVRCAAGTHCVMEQVFCIRAPCLPQPHCIEDTTTCDELACPDPTRCTMARGIAECVTGPTCASTRCARGSYCTEANTGVAQCVPYSTCMNVRCARGYHCEDVPVQCVRAPCPPTVPSCEAN